MVVLAPIHSTSGECFRGRRNVDDQTTGTPALSPRSCHFSGERRRQPAGLWARAVRTDRNTTMTLNLGSALSLQQLTARDCIYLASLMVRNLDEDIVRRLLIRGRRTPTLGRGGASLNPSG